MENKILATVGGMPVTEADVEKFLASLGSRGQSYNNPEGRAIILNQLIDTKLLLLDARRNLLEAEADFKAQLAELKEKLLANYAAEKVIAAAPRAKEEDALSYYNENKEQFLAEQSVNASHILVDSEERAKEILDEINSGSKTFEEAAKEYSSCPSSANGGSLGDFTRGQMVPEFDKAVFEMEAGEITAEPVKTQFGYHLIKLNSKNESSTIEFAEVKDAIMASLTQEKQKKAYESKINQLKIMYPVDKMI